MVVKKTNKKSSKQKVKQIEKDFLKIKDKVKQNIKINKKDIKESASIFVNFMKAVKMEYVKARMIKMFKDTNDIILKPVKFFSSIKVDGSLSEYITKIVAFGLISGVLSILLSFGTIGLIDTLSTIILYPLIGLISSFILSGFLLMFVYLAQGDMNFEKAYKIVTSQSFLFPIGTVLYKLTPSLFFLLISSFAMDCYIIILAYLATVYGLKGKVKLAQIVFGAFFILLLLFYTNPGVNVWLMFKNPSITRIMFI